MKHVLKTQALSMAYGDRPVLSDVTLRFGAGRFTALLGANGSGKSTLLRALMGIAPVQSGAVVLNARPLTSLGRREIAREMAFLPQVNHCPDHLTVGELVELAGFARTGLFGGVRAQDRAGFAAALRTVGLEGAETRRVSALSGGQRQRAFIAMVLAQDTPILLMDEPVNHLDLRYQYAVLDLVRELVTREGKTLIMVLHDLNLALAYADDAVVLKAGQVLAQGPVDDVLSAACVSDAFEVDAQVQQVGDRLICLPRGTQMVDRA